MIVYHQSHLGGYAGAHRYCATPWHLPQHIGARVVGQGYLVTNKSVILYTVTDKSATAYRVTRE